MKRDFLLSILAAAALYPPCLAAQETFATPQEAANALIAATGQNDTAALSKLFGPSGKDIFESGDPSEDTRSRARFSTFAREKMQIVPDNPDRDTIMVGNQDWPFPVPLVRANGQWHFDPAEGRVEILARRIGRHELAVIDICRAYVEAQMEYSTSERASDGTLEYAQKIVSSPGKKDGLFWQGGQDALVPKGFADAAVPASGGKQREPYHGYYFRILKAQGPNADGGAMNYVVKGKMIGGFGLVAYPAEYGVSGVKTFVVSYEGLVYEKDLGPNTAALARAMTLFNPDKTWKPVQGE